MDQIFRRGFGLQQSAGSPFLMFECWSPLMILEEMTGTRYVAMSLTLRKWRFGDATDGRSSVRGFAFDLDYYVLLLWVRYLECDYMERSNMYKGRLALLNQRL